MSQIVVERAIADVLQEGKALLKFISPNDSGATRSHQAGFHLPIRAWKIFTPHSPRKGSNSKHEVRIKWPDGLETNSVVTWYGQGTRHEYRLTRFGRDFPWIGEETVGDLFVLVPHSLSNFNAYLFDSEKDIESLFSALGVQPFDQWALYWPNAVEAEDLNDCLGRLFEEYARSLQEFPSGDVLSGKTIDTLRYCDKTFVDLTPDNSLLTAYESEYKLFRRIESHLCLKDVGRRFFNIDSFLKTAAQIMNRRKARAGRSLENHVDRVFLSSGLPHEMRPKIDGRPDIIIPSARAYADHTFPAENLLAVGIKTTCKDRWRQVLNEAKRVKTKHILTLQPSISNGQLTEMHNAGVVLIVPERLMKGYPNHSIRIMGIAEFINFAKQAVRI